MISPRWRKNGPESWTLSGSRLRRPPQIGVYNRGLRDYPPVWGVSVGWLSFNNPEHLRHFATVLEEMASKLERLAEAHPDVEFPGPRKKDA